MKILREIIPLYNNNNGDFYQTKSYASKKAEELKTQNLIINAQINNSYHLITIISLYLFNYLKNVNKNINLNQSKINNGSSVSNNSKCF